MGPTLEICCADIESVNAAVCGGAGRIELCSALSEGGLTPSAGLIVEAVGNGIPVNILIRPRCGDFVYSRSETAVMLQDIKNAKLAGANGVVIGALNQDGSIDTGTSGLMIEQAKSYGLEVTFHRAFDMCSDPFAALETIIRLGADRLLTSGQSTSALSGAHMIRKLKRAAQERIIIMAGCGVTPENVTDVLLQTGVNEIHASAKATINSAMTFRNNNAHMGNTANDEFSYTATSREAVRRLSEIIYKKNGPLH